MKVTMALTSNYGKQTIFADGSSVAAILFE